jgi:hypothetical protein
MEITKIYLVENCYGNSYKVYIGKTINSRKHNHEKTYGKNIIYTVIDEINSLNYKEYKSLENYWIEQFKQWGFEVLNKNKGGGGPTKWNNQLLTSEKNQIRKEKIKNNKERAENISKSTKGIPLSEERKHKLKGPRPHLVGKKKKPRSEESKKKISNSLKGRNNFWIKGKPLSKIHKEKISEKKSITIMQYDLDENFIKEWNSIIEAANFFKVNATSICSCLNKYKRGIKSTSCGYIWKYKHINERKK